MCVTLVFVFCKFLYGYVYICFIYVCISVCIFLTTPMNIMKCGDWVKGWYYEKTPFFFFLTLDSLKTFLHVMAIQFINTRLLSYLFMGVFSREISIRMQSASLIVRGSSNLMMVGARSHLYLAYFFKQWWKASNTPLIFTSCCNMQGRNSIAKLE